MALPILILQRRDDYTWLVGETEDLQIALQRAGVTATFFSDVKELRNSISTETRVVVLLHGIIAPDTHGDTLVKALNQMEQVAAIFVVLSNTAETGFLKNSTATEFYELAEQGYLPDAILKSPVTVEELIALVWRYSSQ